MRSKDPFKTAGKFPAVFIKRSRDIPLFSLI